MSSDRTTGETKPLLALKHDEGLAERARQAAEKLKEGQIAGDKTIAEAHQLVKTVQGEGNPLKREGEESAVKTPETLAERAAAGAPDVSSAPSELLSLEAFIQGWSAATLHANRMPGLDQKHPTVWAQEELAALAKLLRENGYAR